MAGSILKYVTNIEAKQRRRCLLPVKKMGMTGFDSGQDRYVSMQCFGSTHSNLKTKTITGENNYALAA